MHSYVTFVGAVNNIVGQAVNEPFQIDQSLYFSEEKFQARVLDAIKEMVCQGKPEWHEYDFDTQVAIVYVTSWAGDLMGAVAFPNDREPKGPFLSLLPEDLPKVQAGHGT